MKSGNNVVTKSSLPMHAKLDSFTKEEKRNYVMKNIRVSCFIAFAFFALGIGSTGAAGGWEVGRSYRALMRPADTIFLMESPSPDRTTFGPSARLRTEILTARS